MASNVLSLGSASSAAQRQMDAQRKQTVYSLNRSFQNYEIERQDAYDETVNAIMKARHNALSLGSAVKASTAETTGGRSANMIIRNTEGDTARAVSALQENYKSKSSEIDLNKETAYINAEESLKAINNSAPKMPSAFASAVSAAGITLDAITQQQEIDLKKKEAKR